MPPPLVARPESFIRRENAASAPPPPLTQLLRGRQGGEVRLKLYLTMSLLAVSAPSAGRRHMRPECARLDPRVILRRRSRPYVGVSRPVGRVLCARLRGAAVIHLGLPLPAASCGLPASIGRAALD